MLNNQDNIVCIGHNTNWK